MSADNIIDGPSLAVLRLRKSEERRLKAGHQWVYSNEIDAKATPLREFEPGQAVRIESAQGKPIGNGYVNPHSLICARLVSRDPDIFLDRSLLVHRLKVALSLREMLYSKPFYRLVYGEGDGLPGLIIDRYGDILVAQINTAGMERHKEDIVDALKRVFSPQAILLRNDSGIRQLEGLESYVEVAFGKIPELTELEENGVRFRISLQQGQKTGWFYDHRDNRRRMAEFSSGRRVLDVFSYVGGWGLQAAAAGATAVLCVDSSAQALKLATENAELNGLADRVQTLRADAFDGLRSLREQGERFDMVVVDPPAFIKKRKDLRQGTQAYRRINQLAMQLLDRDGILVSASCSFHMSRDNLLDTVLQAARHVDRMPQLIAEGRLASDHPVHPAIVETDYLKALFFRVLPA